MFSEIKNKKIVISGIQGSGKTTLAKNIARRFRTAVYTPHRYEWQNENVVIFKFDDFVSDFGFFCSKVKEFAKEKKIDCFIVDEFDLLVKNFFSVNSEFFDLWVNHRHYGLTIVVVTRRLQDLTTRIYNTAEFLCLFKIESPQVRELLNKVSDGLGDAVQKLDYFEFIVKQIGKEPRRVKLKL